MDKKNIKVIIAVVCLLIAGGLLAYQFGLFGGGGAPSGTSASDVSFDEDTSVEERSTSTIDPETGGMTLGGASEAFTMPGRRQR